MSENFVPCTRPAYTALAMQNDEFGEYELVLEPIVAWKVEDSRGHCSGFPVTRDEGSFRSRVVYFADYDDWFDGLDSGKGKESLLKHLIEKSEEAK